jgi:hypothetical protein
LSVASHHSTLEPVLSVRQPWASAIFDAGKDVENRSWLTHYRGRLWIHAARLAADDLDVAQIDRRRLRALLESEPRGVLLGHVQLVDVVDNADSPWAIAGAYHWLLERPRRLRTPIAQRGQASLGWIDPRRFTKGARRPREGATVRGRGGPEGVAPSHEVIVPPSRRGCRSRESRARRDSNP